MAYNAQLCSDQRIKKGLKQHCLRPLCDLAGSCLLVCLLNKSETNILYLRLLSKLL